MCGSVALRLRSLSDLRFGNSDGTHRKNFGPTVQPRKKKNYPENIYNSLRITVDIFPLEYGFVDIYFL